MNKIKKEEILNNRAFYDIRSILGNSNWAEIFAILGGRQAGKSYQVFDLFCHQWFKYGRTPFTWLRLTENSTRKLLNNNAFNFGDPDLKRKYHLNLKAKSENIFNIDENGDECLFARCLALSTFYSDKGQGFFDKDATGHFNICLDEMNKEKCEKRTIDIPYCFVNQIENLVRNMKTDENHQLKIFLLGNTLEESSDLMSCFNFLPQTFGRYKIKKKKLVVDYLPESEAYLNMRKDSIASLLMGNASTFTNKIEFDLELISKKKLITPYFIIKFSDDRKDWFTLYNDNIVNKYNNETVKTAYAMIPYIRGEIYMKEKVDQIFNCYDLRQFRFHTLFCQREFRRNLELVKTR